MRLVTAARADKTVQPSIKGSSGAPTPPIWIRWSITENHTKPWFSAHCAFAFTASNVSAGSGPKNQDGLWMPNFIRFTPVLARGGGGRRRSATLACRYAVLCGSDPHCLYIQILFHLLNTGFATIAAHLVAAERDGRIHRLVAIDPHRAGAQPASRSGAPCGHRASIRHSRGQRTWNCRD